MSKFNFSLRDLYFILFCLSPSMYWVAKGYQAFNSNQPAIAFMFACQWAALCTAELAGIVLARLRLKDDPEFSEASTTVREFAAMFLGAFLGLICYLPLSGLIFIFFGYRI